MTTDEKASPKGLPRGTLFPGPYGGRGSELLAPLRAALDYPDGVPDAMTIKMAAQVIRERNWTSLLDEDSSALLATANSRWPGQPRAKSIRDAIQLVLAELRELRASWKFCTNAVSPHVGGGMDLDMLVRVIKEWNAEHQKNGE